MATLSLFDPGFPGHVNWGSSFLRPWSLTYPLHSRHKTSSPISIHPCSSACRPPDLCLRVTGGIHEPLRNLGWGLCFLDNRLKVHFATLSSCLVHLLMTS